MISTFLFIFFCPALLFKKQQTLYYFCNYRKKKNFAFWEEKGDNRAKLLKT